MQVLVSGGTGFIGSNVMRYLVREGHGVVCFDYMPTLERIADIAEDVPLVRGDVHDLDVLIGTMSRHEITHVVHLAYYLSEA